jgi:hypothetical protein
MGFNSAFKGLMNYILYNKVVLAYKFIYLISYGAYIKQSKRKPIPVVAQSETLVCGRLLLGLWV